MDKKKPLSLSWDDFQSMGNPENAPNEPESTEEETVDVDYKSAVRIYKERKQRGGKSVSIIKGIDADAAFMKDLTKFLKVKLGVGGHLEEDNIIIQGTNRDKIIDLLTKKGFKNIKLAGA